MLLMKVGIVADTHYANHPYEGGDLVDGVNRRCRARKTAQSWEQIAEDTSTKIILNAPSSDDAAMQFFISQAKSCATNRQTINLLV